MSRQLLNVKSVKCNEGKTLNGLKRLGFLLYTLPIIALHVSAVNAEWNPWHPDPIIEYRYSYDNVGNITSIEDSVKNSTSTFTYDEVNRLTSAIGQYGAGGIQQTQTYSYNAVGDIAGTPSLPTDGNGNITQIEGKTIYYDYENRPYKITDSTGTITEFKYDYAGQRVLKKVTLAGATAKTYYVGNIYEVSYSTTGAETQTAHIYAGALRVASRITKDGGSNTYYNLGDHLGSTRMMTDALGQTVHDVTYEPWGNTVTESSTTYKANYKFTGQMLDDSTSLYYYGARYYDPSLKRFITPDTIVQSPYDPQSLNRYAYVRNNPLKLIDPTGHEWGKAETGGKYDLFGTYNFYSSNAYLNYWILEPFNLLNNFSGFTGNFALNALGTTGEGIEFAKQAVFGNSFVESILGNYSSEAVDAALLNWGGVISQGIKSISSYYQTAAKIKWAEAWAGSRGYVANEVGSLKLGSKMSPNDFVHVTTEGGAKSILSRGLNPKSFVTQWKYVEGIENPTTFNTMLYKQSLWAEKAGKFDSGAYILRINAAEGPSYYSPFTNIVNGVPQWLFEGPKGIPVNQIDLIKIVGGAQ